MIEFSPLGYRHFLEHIRNQGYGLATFDDLTGDQARQTKRCFMRHDLDVSLDFALEMARLEHSMGVRTTYFVMFRSPIYNLLSRHNSQQLQGLRRLGHQIGLHFDVSCAREPWQPVESALRFELNALEFMLGEKVTAFSLHQPTQAVIEQQIEVPGVLNAYHPGHLRGIRYLSDSNRNWRGKDPLLELTASENSIQILTHPIWWMCTNAIADCWDAAVLANFVNAQRQLLATEDTYRQAREMILIRDDKPDIGERRTEAIEKKPAGRDGLPR